jgi:hypothetical protein
MFAGSTIRVDNSNNSAALISPIRINRIAMDRALSIAPASRIMQLDQRRVHW